MDTDVTLNRLLRANRRNTLDSVYTQEPETAPEVPDRAKKRASLKSQRGRERDVKLDIAQARGQRSDSLPSPGLEMPNIPKPGVPPLVESCNRFMSLASRLKCSSKMLQRGERNPEDTKTEEEHLPSSRVNFHSTFSMLIKIGNVDKNCRRAISVEEQVWQNERKDLIWLEIRARIAGRTLQQQDDYLCAQRGIVPTIIQNIIDYRFVNANPCKLRTSRSLVSLISNTSEGYQSSEETPGQRGRQNSLSTIVENPITNTDDFGSVFGCLCFNCQACSDAIGKALKEVGTLLDSLYNAEALFPSSKAMASYYPLIATQLFNNRLKAMCLWYNIAIHMRIKILGIRRLIKLMQWKANSRLRRDHRTNSECDNRIQEESKRSCLVRFQLDNQNNPSDSNHSSNSDSSSGTEPHTVDPQSPPLDEIDHCAMGKKNTEININGNDDECKIPTPEIDRGDVDNRNGTVDTTTSNESGYISDRSNIRSFYDLNKRDDCDVFNLGPLNEVAKLRLLSNCEESPYRYYHHDMLKTQGVRKAMSFIDKMRKHILKKAYMTFEKYNSAQSQTHNEYDPVVVFEDAKDEELKPEPSRYEDAKNAFELRRYGCWSEETLQMRLPSYRSPFLLLSTISMEVVHDYLCMRLETQPAKPSCLTVKQLIHELKEGLDIATEQRSAFVRNIDMALSGFDHTGEAKQNFVKVIQTFDVTIEKVLKQYLSYLTTMSEVEHMPRSFLEAEWGFSARLAKRMKCAAILAPISFSNIMCNQIDSLERRFEEKFVALLRTEYNFHGHESSEDDDAGLKRHFVYALCREAQGIFSGERELIVHTAQFSRLLATRLRKNGQFASCRAKIFESLMKARNCIVSHVSETFRRTEPNRERDETEFGSELQVIGARVREVMLQGYKLGFEFHKELHRFVNESAQERGKATTGTTQKRPSSINVPLRSRPTLTRSDSIGGEDYDVGVFEDLQSTTSIEYGVPEIRFEGEENYFRKNSFASAISEAKLSEMGSSQEVPTEPQPDEKEWAVQVARGIIDFAKDWMTFVKERCDRGRGLRPRWASQGLEFLMLACDPCNTRHLSEAEFEALKKCMDGCISHVIGSRSPAVASPAPAATPPPQRRHKHRNLQSPLSQVHGKNKEVPTPPTPPSEPDPVVNFHINEESAHSRAVAEAAKGLDQARDEALRKMKAVGRVVESAATATRAEPKLRQVTFRWQRGLKIGAGSFGKVYTVVNTESGQLLAMKEISIGPGDRRSLQRAANELKVLEGIVHPHLVRYYGCEVHREEMLIFMELCVEGSLEALLASTGGGLPETSIRRYTKQLVSALMELHQRKIAHRDVKSGNIFLTNEGHCLKLGDFGCAVKIRGNSTAAGELQGQVGTQAYMAPEVFMKSSGHGRAADIWSLGCVVTEMASGTRPFIEFDSNYQIMYVVGMGGRPAIKESLSDEGRDFCLQCLTHDPEERPSAEQLHNHHFLMVKADEECECKPAFLI